MTSTVKTTYEITQTKLYGYILVSSKETHDKSTLKLQAWTKN